MKMWVRTAVLTALALVIGAGSAGAWGWDAHRWITTAAVDLLPSEMHAVVAHERDALAEHAPSPDLWRSDPEEGHGHYINPELADPSGPPFSEIPHTYDETLAAFGIDSLRKMGTLPWRIEDYYHRLVASMRQPSDSTWVIMAALGHYCSDATMPMHITVNYDGQMTGNRGIHHRFEWWMLEQHADEIELSPVAPLLVVDPLDVTWTVIFDSYADIDTLLAADTDVRRTFREPVRNPRDRHGRGPDAEYDARLFQRLGEIAVRRMELAAQFTAGIWHAAWLEAGRPDLTGAPSPPPPPIAE